MVDVGFRGAAGFLALEAWLFFLVTFASGTREAGGSTAAEEDMVLIKRTAIKKFVEDSKFAENGRREKCI